MTPEFAIWICKETIFTAMLVAAPPLIAGLLIGLMVSLFQAATQINEMTLTFIPKIAIVMITMLVMLPWTFNVMLKFTRDIFTFISTSF